MRDNRRHQPRFRTFNVIDDFNREVLGINIAVSLPASRMSRYLDKLAEYHAIHSKYAWINKAKCTGNMFTYWATSYGITLDDIQLGSR